MTATATTPHRTHRSTPPGTSRLAATRIEHRPSCDLLGLVHIPEAELRRASRAGVDLGRLDTLFPTVKDSTLTGGRRVRLSRGRAYYLPRGSLSTCTTLGTALSRLDRDAPDRTPALRYALLDNLHNLTAAAVYALWQDLTDHPSSESDPRPAALDRLLDCATATTAVRHDVLGAIPRPPAPDDLALLESLETGWRSFRELDSPDKITDELRFLAHRVLAPRPEITAILAPLYGSLSFALAARTVLPAVLGRPIDVHLVRLGFHDQAAINYLGACGTVRHRATAPLAYRNHLAAAVKGATALVVDDNVGYGSTLRATRALVEQLGGRAITRSVESAWTLYHRSGRHDIANAADLPSLRPNLHHSIQHRLIDHLLRNDADAYLRDPAHHVPGTLHQQMETSFDLAVSTGAWSTSQLDAMRTELADAAYWREPPVPRPAPPTTP